MVLKARRRRLAALVVQRQPGRALDECDEARAIGAQCDGRSVSGATIVLEQRDVRRSVGRTQDQRTARFTRPGRKAAVATQTEDSPIPARRRSAITDVHMNMIQPNNGETAQNDGLLLIVSHAAARSCSISIAGSVLPSRNSR